MCPALDGAPPTTTARMAARLTPISVAAVTLQGAGVNFFFSILVSEMGLIVIHEEEKLVMGICCFMEIYIFLL